jgi:prepilin-type N-terminal cleavage/methylation domain-containing protein
MLQQIRKAMKEEKGFTLIELLIVIVILGVLAAIVVFSVSGITDRGKTSACKADVETVTTAVEAFYAQTGAYPVSSANLIPGYLHGPFPADVTYTGGATVTGVGC